MPTGVVASGLPAGWEWDYDGTRWFYTFTANGHVQYHFPSEGDEFPDFVGVTEPAPRLEPEGRLESHQQVRRVTGAAAAPPKKKKKHENGMTATAPRPVGIEWDGDVGGSSSEEEQEGSGGGRTVFEPENLMFLGPQVYADVSPLNEEEEEAAKRTVVGAVVGGVSPAETTSAGTPATKRAEPATGDGEAAAPVIVAEIVEVQVVSTPPPAKEEPMTARGEEATLAEGRADKTERPAAHAHAAVPREPAPRHDTIVAAPEPAPSPPPAQQNAPARVASVAEVTAAQPLQHRHHGATPSPPPPPPQAPTPATAASEPAIQPRYELPAPERPFNPVGIVAEMPTEDTPRSHIELNPIPVEIMDASVLAPIETAAAAAAGTPPPSGVAELPGQSNSSNGVAAVVRQTPPPPQQPRNVPVMMRMKIKRKPTDPNAAIPSPLSASSSSSSHSPAAAAAAVSPPSVASAPTSPPPLAAAQTPPQYKPYAPVSPLQRADTEPVRAPAVAMQQRRQSSLTTAPPPPPVVNPHLSYAPTVLRPAGRKSTSVSPERRQGEAGNQAPGLVQNGMPEKAAPQNVYPGQVPPPGQGPLPGPLPPHGQPGPMPAQGHMQPPGLQDQARAPGPLPTHAQPPQSQLPQPGQGPPQGLVSAQGQVMQNGQCPPLQHGRPMSMMPAAPGKYPPVPIPQPYGQYQRPSPQISQQTTPPWVMPGQQAPGQQTPGQNFATPLHQQQTPPSGWRQSMPLGYPQPPPNGRHSMMGPIVPRKIPLDSQSQPPPPPNQQPAGQGPNSSSTTDSPVVSPLRSRAGSQPSGLSLPSPSPMETPQPQSAASSQIPEQLKLGSVKIGTGASGGSTAGQRRSTTGSYFPPSKDHPVGLVGSIADQFAAEMRTLLGSEAQSSSPAPAVTAITVNPEPKSLASRSTLSSGNVLNRIAEHEVVSTPAPGSANTTLVQPSPPQLAAPPMQISPKNMPKPPQGPRPPSSELPGGPVQNAPARIPSAGQAVPPTPLGPQISMPRPGAPQQQWQGNPQQPMQRPPSVPPQMQMQPNRNKENRWTKWFRSSKPENRSDASQAGMPQQPPPQQPQQWQPGPPMPGHPVQRMSMQGPPIQGSMPGYPIQGQPVQRQSVHGQPLQGQPIQRLPVGGPQPPQTTPMKTYSPYWMHPGAAQGPIPQTVAQQGPLGSHPPQQYLPVQSGQPMQTRPPYGAPMHQMHPAGAPASPAPSQTAPSQLSNSPSQVSISSLPPTGPPQPHPQIASPMQSNLVPAPLSLRPRSGVPAGVPANGQQS
ncbi:hypothetical protein ISF_02056 [Cordyceps fumosorosea ARSEF 2679]|uniref:Uncharacterized protein n=1 Tax=Cordyceps fumosorosea (strain ARSEF 2679) TaxID=1081104 RepID=A0A168CKZ2_CORFA|nr:hypothetical protein ISF_02056 [Cordyceps fumosorosea ARSEF 2679]OAA71505.1 hypothetical protein ISF_02056 [Cordyceps fumosorosea ARSEF 2679]